MLDVTVITSRQLEESDYDKIVEWGKFWRFPIPPKEFLPDNGLCGIMVTDNKGTLYCAGFIYETNSSTCWIEYIISNPKIKLKSRREETLRSLIYALTDTAKSWGYKWAFTSVKNEHLINKYLECGFVVGTKGSTEMVKIL